MAKKIEINENWEPIEVEDLENLFVVIFKHGSFDQGYVEAFDTDDILMQSAYDSLANQYNDCGCDELTKIYLIKLPNTEQVTNMCNTGLFNGNCCDPHVIEATRDLFNRADCEQISCWEGCGLTEGKKKKKVCSSITYTTGYPELNIKHFNKCMGTDGLGNPADHPHLVVGDTLPNGPIASETNGDAAGDSGASSGSEGGAMSESLNEALNLDRGHYDLLPGFVCELLDEIVEKYGKEPWFEKFWEEYRDHVIMTDTHRMKMPGFFLQKYTKTTESLTEAKEETLEDKIRSVIAHKETDDWHDGKAYLFEVSDASKESNNGDIDPFWVEKFDDDEVDFSNLKTYDRTPEEKEDGKYIATFMISGGKNGSGDWTEYLGQLADAFKALKEKTGAEPLLYKLDTDICDDVWTGYVFLYDHEDKVQESLNEDLIVIEPNEAREKLTELQDQIKAEKDEKVRKSLLTLMNIYLFQTYKPSDREDSSITDDEWQEISDWQQDELDKENKEQVEESIDLDEAKLDYTTQKLKMGALESGARGFNAKAASNEKLEFNRMVCQKEGYTRALKIIEDEMIERGLLQRKQRVAIHNYEVEAGYFGLAAAKIVWADRDNPEKLINAYGHSLKDILIVLIFALWMKKADLAGKIKDFILNNYTVTLDELKVWLNKYLKDATIAATLNQVVYASGICVESLEEAILDEDKIWAERIKQYRELPSEIKLLDQKEVEEFIGSLEPEEEFKIGYVTPVYFYKELDNKFSLLKATELVGYTGLDYRDAVADKNVEDHAARVANAQRQIDTYKDGAMGYKLNPEGERFSATYTKTNKLVASPTRSLETGEVDDQGQAVKANTPLNRILFYPKVGSKPRVIYYLDVFGGKGYEKVSRDWLVKVLYNKVQELAFAKDNGITDADRKQLQKWGFASPQEFAAQFPGMTMGDYKMALKLGIDPKDYLKQYPFSRRWTMKDFSAKVEKTIEQDEATISSIELNAVDGANRDLSGSEAKPQVRALYSNQVYYLEHANFVPGGEAPKKFGNSLKEEVITEADETAPLTEEAKVTEAVELDEAKRYVKRYYVRPLNIFCGNKEDIIQALIRAGDQNCSVYSLKRLDNHEDVHLLQPSDIIYYYDDHVLYDKNHVQVMDYDLFVKHEEDRKKVGNVDAISDATFSDIYDDRATEDDLKDKEVIANYKALNNISR